MVPAINHNVKVVLLVFSDEAERALPLVRKLQAHISDVFREEQKSLRYGMTI